MNSKQRFLRLLLLASVLSALACGEIRPPIAEPLKVGPTGRYFVDGEGKPFFWLGDSAWPLFTRYSESQAVHYLKTRAAQGFTVIHSALLWGQSLNSDSAVLRPNVAGELPWLNNNPATPNDAYFRYVDRLVEIARQEGLYLVIGPSTGAMVNDSRAIDTSNARSYGRWVGARYSAVPNIIWVNGGDRNPLGFEEVYRELARGLRDGEQGEHLITFHPCGGRSSSMSFHTDDWLDFDMLQTWSQWFEIYPAVTSDTTLSPAKPVIMCEGAYEDGPEYPTGPITPLIVRRQAWWSFTAGGFHTYGQNQMWRMEPGWEKTLESPGARQVVLMKEILGRLNWWELAPDQGIFAAGIGSERTLNTAMRSTRGDKILVYLSSQCRVFLYLGKIAAREAKATWINPTDGKTVDAGVHLTGNFNGKSFPDNAPKLFATPDFWEDAVLLIEAVESK